MFYQDALKIFFVLAGSLLLCFGCQSAGQKAAKVVILYSNDILGELENCGCDENQLGGLSRKARAVSMTREETKNFLCLDAGNLFFRKKPLQEIEAREFLLKADYILAAYNRMACDAVNIGESDFALGLNPLLDLKKKATFPFISSNITDKITGEPMFEQVVFREKGGLKIGILGLCPTGAEVEKYVCIEDPVATARKMVERIGGQCDFIILLSGLGLEADKALAKQVPRIDLIVAAQADTLLPEALREGTTTIVQAYTRGQYLGRLDITRSSTKRAASFAFSNVLIPLKEDIGEDKEIVHLASEYNAKVSAMNKQEFFKAQRTDAAGASRDVPVYVGGDACLQCHTPQYENWQNTFHARAYNTLVKEGRNYDVECLACHTTGYGEPGGYMVSQRDQSPFLNVQCESCHGPGSRHSGETGGIVRNGGKEVCLGCHNEKNSPRFNYETYLPMVKCPVPKG